MDDQLDRFSAEHLHASIVDTHAQEEFTIVDALGTWAISVDKAVEPPLVTLLHGDTDIGFVLDGDTITIKPGGHDNYQIFDTAENEARALAELSRLFAKNLTLDTA